MVDNELKITFTVHPEKWQCHYRTISENLIFFQPQITTQTEANTVSPNVLIFSNPRQFKKREIKKDKKNKSFASKC